MGNRERHEKHEEGLVPKLRFPEFRDAGEWVEKSLNQITDAIFDGTHQTPKYTEQGVPFFSVERPINSYQRMIIERRLRRINHKKEMFS